MHILCRLYSLGRKSNFQSVMKYQEFFFIYIFEYEKIISAYLSISPSMHHTLTVYGFLLTSPGM